jgi:uncharacterized membrane protein (DUF485 family)
MGTFGDWYYGMRPVSRYYLTLSFVTTVGCHFGFINPRYIILDWYAITHQLQLWRLATNFFYFGRLGFPFLMTMFMLSQYSQLLERTSFDGRVADYMAMLLFGGLVLVTIGFLLDLVVMSFSLYVMVIYVWSQRQADQMVTFFFGLRFEAAYLPWALVAFTVLLGGSPVNDLLGIAVGHLFFFFHDMHPRRGGKQWLGTPRLLEHLFPSSGNGGFVRPQQPAGAQPMQAPGDVPPPRRAGHDWGQGGVRLGRD